MLQHRALVVQTTESMRALRKWIKQAGRAAFLRIQSMFAKNGAVWAHPVRLKTARYVGEIQIFCASFE